MIARRALIAVAASALAIAVLAGCSENPSFSSDGDNTGYVSGGGAYKEIPPADRKQPQDFTATLDTGGTVTSTQLLGKVQVLNFWYAGCGPCRVEAPRLEKVYRHYKGSVEFLGVNTYDQAPTARVFEQTHKVTYPSVIDTNNATVQYAYSSYVSPDSVPVTLVIDKHGRVAARVTGEVEDASILESLVDRVIAEGK
ncbi:MAG: TlpA disulfide reductase family protein [Galbitalea sp.]